MSMQTMTNVAPYRLARLVKVSRILNSTTNVQHLLGTIMDEAVALTGAQSASIMLLDPRTRELRFKAASNGMPPKLMNMVVPLESSIAGAIFNANEPMIIADVSRDERWHKNIDEKIDFHTESILGVPMHDSDNQPLGVIEAINKLDGTFTMEDVETLAILADLAGVAVEKARLFEALQDANKRLSELDELKTNFISIASHELRTPLSIILGYVSFLRESADPALAEQMDSVLNAAIRLRSLIQDMLNLGYVDAGGIELNTHRVSLIPFLQETISSRQESVQALQHVVKLHQLNGSPQITMMADPKLLELIFGNLLDNALKFTPAGGAIWVRLQEKANELWISVRDSGIGIPAEQVERIFDRFHQVEHPLTRNYEGMGLGLAIAKELVELHNGRIWAQSKVGEGSEFFVAFPLQ